MRLLALFLFGALALVGVLELALRILPGPTATRVGYYVDPVILTYPAHHRWTTASGWDLRNAQTVRSNNYGFLTSRDFEHDATAVALIGDSFVDASMLPESERLGPQLEALLGGRRVYVLGGPGSSLLDYAERVRFAQQRFGIRDFVLVLERGDLRQALCGSGNVHGPCLDRSTLRPLVETQASPGLLKVVVRESAAAQYLLGQLRLDPARLWAQIVAGAAPVTPESKAEPVTRGSDSAPAVSPEVEPVFSLFTQRVAPYMGSGRMILVLDADRAALYPRTGAKLARARPDPDRLRLLELAHAQGFEIIDLEAPFARHIERSSTKLEVGPNDAHWNRIANGIVAAAIADRLTVTPSTTPVKRSGEIGS